MIPYVASNKSYLSRRTGLALYAQTRASLAICLALIDRTPLADGADSSLAFRLHRITDAPAQSVIVCGSDGMC
jgi:hypothetical protein